METSTVEGKTLEVQPSMNSYPTAALQDSQQMFNIVPDSYGSLKTPKKSKWMKLTDKDSLLTPRSRACSMDNLLNRPHYMTRNALKRINEQQLSVLDESCLSISSNEANISQNSPNLSRNPFRSSKSRKSTYRFNFGLFSKPSKSKSTSEFALHQATSFENLDPLDCTQNTTISTDFNEEKKSLRKRRL